MVYLIKRKNQALCIPAERFTTLADAAERVRELTGRPHIKTSDLAYWLHNSQARRGRASVYLAANTNSPWRTETQTRGLILERVDA